MTELTRFAQQFLLPLIILSLAVLTTGQPVQAQNDNPLLYELLDRIELLEQEVRQLRGELEVLQHQRQRQPVPQQPPTSALTPSSTPLSPGSVAPPPLSISPPGSDEQGAYDAALSRLRSGQYEQAVTQFENFLARYSASGLTPDAYYWLGESYYVLRRFDQAQQIFLTLGADYPRSDKLPDAMLKLGYIYSETGDSEQAREMLRKLIEVYPNSVAASLAETHLRSLR